MRVFPSSAGLSSLGLIVLAVSGCFGAPEYEPERLPPIADYRPSQWDMERYRSDLARLAEDLDIADPPAVEIVRWVNREDVVDTMVACLTAKGVPAEKTDEFGFAMNAPPDQAAIMNLAHYRCAAEYPVRLDTERPASDEEARFLYTYLVEEWLPCAAELGYTEIAKPSFEAYRASLRQEAPDPVLEDLVANYSLDQAGYDSLYDVCPYRPESFRQYDR